MKNRRFFNYKPKNWKFLVNLKDNKTKIFHYMKFFRQDSIPAGKYTWKWPFIYITFFKENQTHVWNYEKSDIMVFKREIFYPLMKRPLGNLWFNTPHIAGYILRRKYHSFRCGMGHWAHKYEVSRCHDEPVPCSTLWTHYPQVWSYPTITGEIEVLKLAGCAIRNITLTYNVKGWRSERPYGI